MQMSTFDNTTPNVYTFRISMRDLTTYARVFQSGNSQAVRLPKEFRFNAEQVEIFRQGNDIRAARAPASAAAILMRWPACRRTSCKMAGATPAPRARGV